MNNLQHVTHLTGSLKAPNGNFPRSEKPTSVTVASKSGGCCVHRVCGHSVRTYVNLTDTKTGGDVTQHCSLFLNTSKSPANS